MTMVDCVRAMSECTSDWGAQLRFVAIAKMGFRSRAVGENERSRGVRGGTVDVQ